MNMVMHLAAKDTLVETKNSIVTSIHWTLIGWLQTWLQIIIIIIVITIIIVVVVVIIS